MSDVIQQEVRRSVSRFANDSADIKLLLMGLDERRRLNFVSKTQWCSCEQTRTAVYMVKIHGTTGHICTFICMKKMH